MKANNDNRKNKSLPPNHLTSQSSFHSNRQENRHQPQHIRQNESVQELLVEPAFRSMVLVDQCSNEPLRQSYLHPQKLKNHTPLIHGGLVNQVERLNNDHSPLNESMNDYSSHLETKWWSPIIKKVGLFYQLSSYNVEVEKAQLDKVLCELSDTFRLNSLQIVYGSNPTACAKCVACLEDLEFNVFVWRSRTSKNKYVIEVDRTMGDCVPFHTKYAKLILQAVTNASSSSVALESTTSTNDSSTIDPISRGTSEFDMEQLEATDSLLNRCHVLIQNNKDYTNDRSIVMNDPIESALTAVHDLLTSDRYHDLSVALESLVKLTDPFVSGLETSKEVSRVILRGSTSSQNNRRQNDIQKMLLCLATTGRTYKDSFNAEDLLGHSFVALTVIAQSVNHATASDCNCLVHSVRMLLPEINFIELLLRKIRDAQHSPHLAYLAAHILSVLCRNEIQEVCLQIKDEFDLIKNANRIGSVQHAALELASSRLLYSLDAMV